MTKWVPTKMEWFLADVIQQLLVEGEQDSAVWVNTILIRASSVEEAYEKAIAKGQQHESTWINTDGKQVTSRFRGLRDLLLIYEDLEDGAEIMWEEHEPISENEIEEMITPKERLGAFELHGSEQDVASPAGGNHG